MTGIVGMLRAILRILMLCFLATLLLVAAAVERAVSARPRIKAGQPLWSFFNHSPLVWAAP